MNISHCYVNFGLEQNFLPEQLSCNSLWHRGGHQAKSSIPSYKLDASLCLEWSSLCKDDSSNV